MTKFVNKENNLRARYSLEERKYLVGKWDQPTWNFLNKKIWDIPDTVKF